MSYHYFVAQEYDPALMVLFDSVFIDDELENAQVEDSAGFRMSLPLPAEEDIRLRDASVVLNEDYVLVIGPDTPLPIVFESDAEFPAGDQSVLFWLRPIAGAGEQGLFQYGNLSASAVALDTDTYELRVQVGVNVITSVQEFTEEGVGVFVVATGSDVEVFANNLSLGAANGTALSGGDVTFNHDNGDLEVEFEGFTIIPAALTAQDRDDLYQIARVGYITRRAESGDTIQFLSDETVATQGEWHYVGV